MKLCFDNVCKSFQETAAVRNISFKVEPGEFAALAGPSGSGKTTILNLASGLDHPTSGRVTLLGHDLKQLTETERTDLRRKSVGFVFQSYNLLSVLTAVENIEYPLALQQIPARKRRREAIEMLDCVGLGQLGNRRPHQLSGGQQQRVAVARALAIRPEIIFADEPTANLDSQSAERLLELFQSLSESRGITFLFSSHDSRVLKLAKRILYVSDGTIHEQTNRFRISDSSPHPQIDKGGGRPHVGPPRNQ